MPRFLGQNYHFRCVHCIRIPQLVMTMSLIVVGWN